MLKGSKVVFVAYVHNIDTFNAMSKGSKDCYVHNIDTFRKKFWKAEN